MLSDVDVGVILEWNASRERRPHTRIDELYVSSMRSIIMPIELDATHVSIRTVEVGIFSNILGNFKFTNWYQPSNFKYYYAGLGGISAVLVGLLEADHSIYRNFTSEIPKFKTLHNGKQKRTFFYEVFSKHLSGSNTTFAGVVFPGIMINLCRAHVGFKSRLGNAAIMLTCEAKLSPWVHFWNRDFSGHGFEDKIQQLLNPFSEGIFVGVWIGVSLPKFSMPELVLRCLKNTLLQVGFVVPTKYMLVLFQRPSGTNSQWGCNWFRGLGTRITHIF